MHAVEATRPQPDMALAPPGLGGGVPCVFGRSVGFLHAGRASTGVVLCSPWGFEDLAMRKSWRLLAEAIAAAGYPCVRFDYPGTGDADGAMTEVHSRREWVAAIHAAADTLRRHSDARHLVLLGQSLGAALAVEAATERDDVVGLHLIAPVVKGRAYVRELAATAALVAARIGISPDLEPGEGLSVIGFSLSDAMAESVKAIDLLALERPRAGRAHVFDVPGRKAATDLVAHLAAVGGAARLEAIEPYRLMVSDATSVQPLPVGAEAVVAALRADHPGGGSAVPRVRVASVELIGAGFREEPVRFGSGGALFGVLCQPSRIRGKGPAAILLNRGLNAHIGWRRASVDHARALAAAGVVSLRLDVAGLGESRDEPGRPADLIYSDLLAGDIGAAVDLLVERGFGPIALAGVCSGAYMALVAAGADPRVGAVVAVNAQRLVWNPAENAEDVIRYGLRSMSDYVGDLRGGTVLRKLIRSPRRVAPALRFLAKRATRGAAARVPLRLRSALGAHTMADRVVRFFGDLERRGVQVSLVYSAGDPGLLEMRSYFGDAAGGVPFKNLSVSVLPAADHNLTATRASRWMLDHLVDVLQPATSARPMTRSGVSPPLPERHARPLVAAAGQPLRPSI